jgi:protein-L-isoaspartate(D-aspartate) O-methyltransferase
LADETRIIEAARAAFANELRYVANVRSDRVIAAFAMVPREAFLGEKPWRAFELFGETYWDVPQDDPTAAYHNILYAIDAARGLNNGHPEFWARLLDTLDIAPGTRAIHVGAGLGYYSAIIAELVGPEGHVVAVEIDPGLAERARTNLSSRGNVSLVAGDGATLDPGPADVIVVNAGTTHPMPCWLKALTPGGRLLLPLTAEDGLGTVFRIARAADSERFAAKAVSSTRIYPCASARTESAARRLGRALTGGGQRFVSSLRTDTHDAERECWLHGDGFCLSTRAP